MLGRTPASTAARSLDAPRAIASQNRTTCSRRPAGGRPLPRFPAAAARLRAGLLLGIATPQRRALRQPVEFTPSSTGHTPGDHDHPADTPHRTQTDPSPRPRQHRPHQVILRHPIQQRRRHQQRLLAVARDEVLRHAANSIKRLGRDFPDTHLESDRSASPGRMSATATRRSPKPRGAARSQCPITRSSARLHSGRLRWRLDGDANSVGRLASLLGESGSAVETALWLLMEKCRGVLLSGPGGWCSVRFVWLNVDPRECVMSSDGSPETGFSFEQMDEAIASLSSPDGSSRRSGR